MRIPTFGISVLGGSLFRIAIGASPVPAADDAAARLRHVSAAQSGAITFASSAGVAR